MKNTPEKRLDIVEDTSKASSEAVKELDEVDGKTKREIAKKFKEKLKNFKKEATPQKDNNKEKDNNKKLNKLKNNREAEYKELLDALGNDFVPKMKEYFKQAEHRNKIKDNNPSDEEIIKSLGNDKLGIELV